MLIDKNTTNDGLDKIKQNFKDKAGLKITFKGIKRNSDNEITAIKIDVKGKEVSASHYSSNSEPIKPINISYNSEKNSISIGKPQKMHKSHYAYEIQDKDGNIKIKKSKKGKLTFVTKKDKAKKIELKLLSEDGEDGEHVWVHKSDGNDNVKVEFIEIKEGVHTIKVIDDVTHEEHPEEVHEIEIIKEGKGEGEKVFIIRKEGDNKDKILKKGDYIFTGDDDVNALIFIDGKESSQEAMNALGSDKIEKIEILKGDKATEKYGEKAKHGVIHITTKKE